MKPLTESEGKSEIIIKIRKLRIEAEQHIQERLRNRIRRAKRKNDHFWIQYNKKVQ